MFTTGNNNTVISSKYFGVAGPSVYVMLSLVNKGTALSLQESCRRTELGGKK